MHAIKNKFRPGIRFKMFELVFKTMVTVRAVFVFLVVLDSLKWDPEISGGSSLGGIKIARAEDTDTRSSYEYESEKLQDVAGFEAIRHLHKQMDDDLSGSIDIDESSEFVREELHIKEKDPINRRQQTFHNNNDYFITIDDLWIRWLKSTERNWTVEETVQWLQEGVELPQYQEVFQKNAVDGLALPRIAIQNASFLVNVLRIQNPVHRQKLQLKAMDVVLFGYRHRKLNYWKDALLVGCVSLAVFLFAVNRYQRSKAEKELQKLTSHKDKLLEVENDFRLMQDKLEEEMQKHELLEKRAKEEGMNRKEEVQNLRLQLQNAERRIEQGVIVSGVAPLALQPLLRKTCEIELGRINRAKLEGLREMREAIETVEKLKKKQASVLYSLKMAVNSSAVMENLDQKIVEIKQKMEDTARLMEECQRRWTQIESLCGYPILDVTYELPASGGIPRPSSINGLAQLTRLPLALTSALAAVPNAFGAGGGIIRPQLVSTPIEEIDESGPTATAPTGGLIRAHTAQALLTRTVQPVACVDYNQRLKTPDGAGTTFLPSKERFLNTSPPVFSLGESGMRKSDSAENFLKRSDDFICVSGTTVGGATVGNDSVVDSSRVKKPRPNLEYVGKTDSQDSSVSGGSSGTNGSEERKKKGGKFSQLFQGKKDK